MAAMKLVCIGDSLTYGYQLKRNQVWTYLLQQQYEITVVNQGINGDTTGGMLARFYQDVLEQRPKGVFIMGGSNDLILGVSVSLIQANLMTMVQQARGRHILPVIGIPPFPLPRQAERHWPGITDFEQVAAELKQLREQVHRVAAGFVVPVVDFYQVFDDLSQREDLEPLYLDGLHPTARGNEIMAEAIPFTALFPGK